jgi:hypothetical protein
MDTCRRDGGIWIILRMGIVLCLIQAPAYAESPALKGSASPLRDCYQDTQLAIYQAGNADKKIQLPVRVNLLNDWVSLRFQSAASKTISPKAAKVEKVQLSKLWRQPTDFIATEKLAKRCLSPE